MSKSENIPFILHKIKITKTIEIDVRKEMSLSTWILANQTYGRVDDFYDPELRTALYKSAVNPKTGELDITMIDRSTNYSQKLTRKERERKLSTAEKLRVIEQYGTEGLSLLLDGRDPRAYEKVRKVLEDLHREDNTPVPTLPRPRI